MSSLAKPTETPATDVEDGSIARRLKNPVQHLGLASLAESWFHAIATWRCPGKAALASDPSAPNKIRGAWGQVLMQSASPEVLAGQSCPWSPPCALDVFMGDHGGAGRGLHFPKPYVLALDADGADLLVSLTVFGFATNWMEAGVEAMTAGLRRGLRFPGRVEILNPVERKIVTHDGVRPPPPSEHAVLAFVTPLTIRSGAAVSGSLAALVPALGNRVSGLARWQDAEAVADWRALKRAAATLHINGDGAGPTRWRRTARSGGAHALTGIVGPVGFSGDLTRVLPLLVLGQTCHVGSHAALGMGRYKLTLCMSNDAETQWKNFNMLELME